MKSCLLFLILLSILHINLVNSRIKKKLKNNNLKHLRSKDFPKWENKDFAASFLFSRRLGSDVYYKQEKYDISMEPYVVRVEYKITDSMKYIPKVTLRKDNFPLKLYGFLKYIFFQFKQSKSTTKFFPDDNLFLIYNSEYYDCLNTFKQILSTSNNGLRDFHLN